MNLQYSSKNIPISSKTAYKKCLVQKTESFLKRIRWKAFFFSNNDQSMSHERCTYNFKSTKCPPQDPSLKNFEHDMVDLISGIQFKHIPDSFQRQLTHGCMVGSM